MSVQAILEELRRLDVIIRVVGNDLHVDAPKAVLTQDRLERIRGAKPAIVAAIRSEWMSKAKYCQVQERLTRTTNPKAADEWRIESIRCRLRAGDPLHVCDLPGDLRTDFEVEASRLESSGQHREVAEHVALMTIRDRILRFWAEPLPFPSKEKLANDGSTSTATERQGFSEPKR